MGDCHRLEVEGLVTAQREKEAVYLSNVDFKADMHSFPNDGRKQRAGQRPGAEREGVRRVVAKDRIEVRSVCEGFSTLVVWEEGRKLTSPMLQPG